MVPERSLWYGWVRFLVRNGFFRTMGGLESIGEENIPATGPLIIAPNHLSNLDPPLVGCAQNRRQLTFMAKEELFEVPVFGRLIRSLGAFPIRRGETDTRSIREAIARLGEGRALLVFPEGSRGDGRSLRALNRGVGVLARRTGAAVVPVGIAGTEIVLPRGRRRPTRAPMKVAFGKPFTYAEVAPRGNETHGWSAFSHALESRIVAACASLGLALESTPAPPPGAPRSDLP
jgi:1-acyl-sn-glycerol-3-phosphate acyltransferase